MVNWKEDIDLFLYMNLERRTDRNEQIKHLIRDQWQIPLEKIVRIPAVDAKETQQAAFTACTQTHLSAVNFALTAKCKFVCLLEDDVSLIVSPEIFSQKVQNVWKYLNGNFDVLYLTMTPIRHSASILHGLVKVHQALAMPAMIIHHQYLRKMRSIYQEALTIGQPHDMITQKYQMQDRWYGFWPPLARQRPGFSDIEKKEVNYGYLDVQGSMLQQ